MSALRALRTATVTVLSSALALTVATGPAAAGTMTRHLPPSRVYTADLHSVRLLASEGTTAKTIRLPKGGRRPLISSDGKRIAYVTDGGIRVMSPNGAHDHYLVKGKSLRLLGWQSNDSSALFFMGGGFPLSVVDYGGGVGTVTRLERTLDPTISSVTLGTGGLLVADIHGWKAVRPQTGVRLAPAPCSEAEGLTWSGDGLHLAFTCNRMTYMVTEVYDVVTGTFSVLPRRNLSHPQWLDNGTLVAAHFGPSGFSKELTGWSAAGKHLWNQRVSNGLLSLVATD